MNDEHLVLGLDIGGANLKAADTTGWCASQSFELWKRPQELSAALQKLVVGHEAALVAVTMTGELADGYASKREGVERILQSVDDAFDVPVVVWQTSGEFVSPQVAAEFWQLTAAANWHALATWVGRIAPSGSALLIDIGSTTTDIIPIERGVPVSHGRTDTTRLASGELVYTGVRRTPLCSLLPEVEVGGLSVNVAAEWFATADDIWLLLGCVVEDPTRFDTADGRARTVTAAEQRLARMVCADVDELCALAGGPLERSGDPIIEIAQQFAGRQRELVASAIGRVLSNRPGETMDAIVVSGEGSFLAVEAIEATGALSELPVTMLTDALGTEAASAACAVAVAQLADERVRTDRP